MAKSTWCTVAPMSGGGNGSISISAAQHTGRVVRKTTVTVINAHGSKPSASINVTQAAKNIFLELDGTMSGNTYAKVVPYNSNLLAYVICSGTTNAKGLIIESDGSQDVIYKNIKVKINGGTAVPITYGTAFAIAGDIGAAAQYKFEIIADIVQTNQYNWVIRTESAINCSDGTIPLPGEGYYIATEMEANPKSTLSLSNSSINLVEAGTAQTVDIISSDEWTVT